MSRWNQLPLITAVALMGAGPALLSQAAKAPVKPIPVPQHPSVLMKKQAKLEIKTISVEANGMELSFLASVENKGEAPSTGQEELYVFRLPPSGGAPLFANSIPISAIAAGATAVQRITWNPDPSTGTYLLKVVAQGKDVHVKSTAMAIPTAAVELNQVSDSSGSNWVAKVRNTWVYGLRELRLQISRKMPSTAAWEIVGEKMVGPIAFGASVQSAGKWDPGISQYKATVLMRRTPNEPWKELATQTATAAQ